MANNHLSFLNDKLVRRTKKKFVIEIGGYEITIDVVPEGKDIFELSKIACEKILVDSSILEDDMDFYNKVVYYMDQVIKYKLSVDPDSKKEMANWKKELTSQALKLIEEFVPSEDEEEEEEELESVYTMEYFVEFISDDYQNTRGEREPKPHIPSSLHFDKNTLLLTFNTDKESDAMKWIDGVLRDAGFTYEDVKFEFVDGQLQVDVDLDAEYDDNNYGAYVYEDEEEE